MGKKIIWFWNLVHYNVFIGQNKITNFILSPFFKILRSQKVKNLYAKRNVNNPEAIVKDALLNPEYGSNSTRSFGFMGFLTVCILFSFVFFFEGIFKKTIDFNIFLTLLITALAYAINYYMLLKDKRHIYYFQQFSELEKNDKRKFGWISFIFIIIIILFLVFSLIVMVN